MPETKAAASPCQEKAATKSNLSAHRIPLSRGEFLRNCIGSALTLLVAAADCLGDQRAVDELLRLKDECNRGPRR